MIHPHIVHQTGDIMILSHSQVEKLREDPRSILWINDGLYALIPIEVVKNGLESIDNHNKRCEMVGQCWTSEWPLKFYWEQAVEVPVSTGGAMEQYNGSKLE